MTKNSGLVVAICSALIFFASFVEQSVKLYHANIQIKEQDEQIGKLEFSSWDASFRAESCEQTTNYYTRRLTEYAKENSLYIGALGSCQADLSREEKYSILASRMINELSSTLGEARNSPSSIESIIDNHRSNIEAIGRDVHALKARPTK